MSKYYILGGGMSGLLCAKALSDLRQPFVILDQSDEPRKQTGLHYLHDSCGCPSKVHMVRNFVTGQKEGMEAHEQYAQKLHLPKNNSLHGIEDEVVCWNFQEAYDWLWEQFSGAIIKKDVTPDLVDHLLNHPSNFQVINTIPLHVIRPEAICRTTDIYINRGTPADTEVPFEDVVIYNVDHDVNWYRFSNVNGEAWTETKKPEKDSISISKVMSTTFEPVEENLHLMGRLGAWNKKWLAHDSYYETIKLVTGDKR